MTFVTNPNDGVRIYFEVEGEGPPLVLHHGGGSSHKRWREFGYDVALRDDFRLILFDARAHGESDKPTTPEAYRYEHWVQDIVAVLDDLGIERAHFFGYSLGGLIGLRIPLYAPDRFASIILGGCHPFDLYDFWQSEYELYRDGGGRYIERREAAGNPVSAAEVELLEAGVYEATMLGLRGEPAVDGAMPDFALPLMLYAGSLDERAEVAKTVIDAAPLISRGVFMMFAGLSHATAFQQSDIVLPYVRAFLASVEAAQG